MRLRGLAGACAILIAALAATGCGTTGLPEAGDTTRGKELFKEKCAQCHTLADAGTRGVIGPNLDDAFRQSRTDGLGVHTIEAVVRNQISYAVEEPPTGAPGMPRDIVTGEDADSVALYVASVASLPVRAQPGAETGPGPAKRAREARRQTARRSSPRQGAAAATSSRPPVRAERSARTSTRRSRRRTS